MKKAVIIGLGLIGGSFALELKKRLGYHIAGIDLNPNHIEKALALGIIDESTDYNHLTDADLVLIAVPVNHIGEVLIEVLNKVGEHTLVMDAGSVKGHICEVVATHPHRQNFVAAHPMAGTERIQDLRQLFTTSSMGK